MPRWNQMRPRILLRRKRSDGQLQSQFDKSSKTETRIIACKIHFFEVTKVPKLNTEFFLAMHQWKRW